MDDTSLLDGRENPGEDQRIIQVPSDNYINYIQTLPPRKRHFGKSLVFLFYHGEPLCTIGPHFSLFLCALAYIVIQGILVYFFTATQLPQIIQIAYIGVSFLTGLSFLAAALKNPGIITSKNPDDHLEIAELRRDPRFCKKCKIIKEKKIDHCLDCDVCVQDYDHHCPWTGKCIAGGNIYLFYFFVTMMLIYFLSSTLLILFALYNGFN